MIATIAFALIAAAAAVQTALAAKFAEKLLERRAVTSGCGKGTTFTHAIDALQARPAPPGPRADSRGSRPAIVAVGRATTALPGRSGVRLQLLTNCAAGSTSE